MLLILLAAGCGLPEQRNSERESSPAIRLIQPASPTPRETIRLSGYAPPGAEIELYVNGRFVSRGLARVTGIFRFERVPLEPGVNEIQAVMADTSSAPGGGLSRRIGSQERRSRSAVRVRVVRLRPRSKREAAPSEVVTNAAL